MNPASRLRKITITLLLLVLIPAFYYTAYEFNSLSEREAFVTKIYTQQLETILYSVNQFAWDIASTWAGRVNSLADGPPAPERFAVLHDEQPAIRALVLLDGQGQTVLNSGNAPAAVVGYLEDTLRARDGFLGDQLARFQRSGYRKMESLVVPLPDSGENAVVLLFALEPRPERAQRFAGIQLDPARFINGILAGRLNDIDAASDGFRVEVRQVEPGGKGGEVLDLSRPFWIFPRHQVAIHAEGPGLDDLIQARFQRNLLLLLALSLLLGAGAWFVYRTIRREMELAQIKSDFVSNISHELRTPLALIRMFAETLEMGRVRTAEKRQEYYRIIGQESERLTHLVNNILNFSRIEAGRKEYHLEPVAINAIVDRVLESYQFHLANKGFELDLNLCDGDTTVSGDGEALFESLVNLLDNAIKYSGESRWVAIRTTRNDDRVVLEVADRGIGIAPEHQRQIFDKFFRVSTGLVHTVKGSGLGLSLVHHIMDAHGGRVELESAPGRGSRFRLVFPVLRHGADHRTTDRAAPASPAAAPSDQKGH